MCLEKNWGIGDFGDLRLMLVDVVICGGVFIGLNLIYVFYLVNLESVSFYSFLFCCWLNVIYIDVNVVEDFCLSEEV